MKQLEILVVSPHEAERAEVAALLDGEGMGLTAAPDDAAALGLLRGQGLGFDALVLARPASPALADVAAAANMALVCLVSPGEATQWPACDVAVARPLTRRSLLDALHHALARHGTG